MSGNDTDHAQDDRALDVTDRLLARRLVGFLKPYWKPIVGASALSLAIALLTLAGPKIVQVTIDDHIAKGDVAGVGKLSALYVLVIAAIFALEYARDWLTSYVGQQAMFDLRRELFAKLQQLSLPFFDRNPVGRIMTRLTGDVAALNEMFSQGLTTLAGDLFLLVSIGGILVWYDWKLSLLIFLTMPLLLAAGWWFRKTVRAGYSDVRLRLSQMNAYLQENLSGMRTVQAYNREPENLRQFHHLNDLYRVANMKTVFAHAVFLPVVELIASIALAMIVWYGGIAALNHTITVGTIVLFIQYSSRFYQPIKDLSEKFNVLQTAMASSERIFKLLDEQPTVTAPPNPKPFHHLEDAIEFENVWFAYQDEEWVLKDVSFKVRRGETVALVGATGSGKTTTISLLARFYDVHKGRVTIDGTDVREFDPHDLRRRMALVLQDNFLFSGDIASNIRLGNETIDDARLRSAAANVNAAEFIDALPNGYDSEVLERGATYSTGQKQLLAFARALAFDPEILVLDEATASIDTETELLIQDALNNLLKGRTSLVIAHRLSTITHADRILVFHKGRICESGTHTELLQGDGIYRKLYELQFRQAQTATSKRGEPRDPAITAAS